MVLPGKALALVHFHAEGLDHPVALDGLLQQGRQVSQRALPLAAGTAHFFVHLRERENRDGKDNKGEQGEEPVFQKCHHHQCCQGGGVAHHRSCGLGECLTYHRGVVGDAGENRAGRIAVKIGEGQGLEVDVQRVAQVSHDTLANIL